MRWHTLNGLNGLRCVVLTVSLAVFLTLALVRFASAVQTHPPISPAVVKNDPYRGFLGRWTGTLTYRDYKTEARETLPTQLEVTPQGSGMAFHFVYDDGPGKTVEGRQTVTIDPDHKTYTVQDQPDQPGQVFNLTGLEAFLHHGGTGVLALAGTGIDAGQPAEVRNTITLNKRSLTILHETRHPGGEFMFRNCYRFMRQTTSASSLPLLSAKQLQADCALFRRAYEQLHPGLYRYNTPEQMEAHFAELAHRLDHDQSLADAYVAFAVFLTQIQCGHSYPNFYNQPRTVVEALFKNRNRVPFYFRWIERKMIVTRNFSNDPRLTPGAEILAIDGTPTGKILSRLLTVSRADGGNDAKRINNMEVTGIEQYPAFDLYFPMLYPQTGSSFRLKVRPQPAAAPIALTVDALTYEQRLAPYKAEADAIQGDTPFWELRFLPEDVAYLRMPSWVMYNSRWDWKSFLTTAFDQIAQKGCRNLVIDLRGNEGGSDVGSVLLSHLIRHDLKAPTQFRRWTRYRTVPEDLRPYLDTWDKSFLDWGADAHGPENGYYRMTRFDDSPDGDVVKATPHPFTGATYVLVDASNSSATFEFDRLIQANHLGLLVGQTTGGSQRGINGGAFFFLRLPNSGIETDIPLVGAFPPDVHPTTEHRIEMSVPDTGLTPDIPVAPRIEDIRDGIDTELKAVQQIIHSHRP
jgi:C-terminal processing protease CtpA/Prc